MTVEGSCDASPCLGSPEVIYLAHFEKGPQFATAARIERLGVNFGAFHYYVYIPGMPACRLSHPDDVAFARECWEANTVSSSHRYNVGPIVFLRSEINASVITHTEEILQDAVRFLDAGVFFRHQPSVPYVLGSIEAAGVNECGLQLFIDVQVGATCLNASDVVARDHYRIVVDLNRKQAVLFLQQCGVSYGDDLNDMKVYLQESIRTTIGGVASPEHLTGVVRPLLALPPNVHRLVNWAMLTQSHARLLPGVVSRCIPA